MLVLFFLLLQDQESSTSGVDESLLSCDTQGPRKTPISSREYGFSVEQSIAQGLPIIPKERGRKGDHHHPQINSQTSLQTLLRLANDWPADEVEPAAAAAKPEQLPAARPVRSALRSPNSPPKMCGPVMFGANSRRTISPVRRSQYNVQRRMAAAKNGSCQAATAAVHFVHPAYYPSAAQGYLFFYPGHMPPPPQTHMSAYALGPAASPMLPSAASAGQAVTAGAPVRGRSPHQHPRHPVYTRPVSASRKSPRQRQQQQQLQLPGSFPAAAADMGTPPSPPMLRQ